jgi:rSAM/selenodomain-associated transferase 2
MVGSRWEPKYMLVTTIIPTLNEERHIRDTIRAARQDYMPDELEIIVVDGGSQDGTLHLIPPDVQVIQSKPGRATQMNLGAAHAHGEILVFCHADSLLPDKWRSSVIGELSKPNVSGGTFQLAILPEEGVLKFRNRIKYPANWRLMYGDQVQFMRRDTFEQIGGFPAIPIMEDLEMSRSLAQVGQLVRIPLRVKTSSRRFLGKKPRNQWLLSIRCVILYLYFGKTPEEIGKIYHRGAS